MLLRGMYPEWDAVCDGVDDANILKRPYADQLVVEKRSLRAPCREGASAQMSAWHRYYQRKTRCLEPPRNRRAKSGALPW